MVSVKTTSNAVSLRMLDILICASQSGTGGVVMSLEDWASTLGCCRRGIWNHRARLGAHVQVFQLWEPLPGDKGSQRGHLLIRLAGPLATLAAIERRARSSRTRKALITRSLAKLCVGELNARAARRRYDLSGARWRGERRLATSNRVNDLRTREARALNRQNFPNSPLPSGLLDMPPQGEALGVHPETPEEGTRSARHESIALERNSLRQAIESPNFPTNDAVRGGTVAWRASGSEAAGQAQADAAPIGGLEHPPETAVQADAGLELLEAWLAEHKPPDRRL